MKGLFEDTDLDINEYLEKKERKYCATMHKNGMAIAYLTELKAYIYSNTKFVTTENMEASDYKEEFEKKINNILSLIRYDHE